MNLISGVGMRFKARRIVAIISIFFLYLSLTGANAFCFFSSSMVIDSPSLWISFGFFSFTALMFLVIGALVWLYGRDRQVALLLFCFSVTMMMTLAVETVSDRPFFGVINYIGGVLSVFLASALLLFFPIKYTQHFQSVQMSVFAFLSHVLHSKRFVQAYILFLVIMGVIALIIFIAFIALIFNISRFLSIFTLFYYMLGISGILASIIYSYYRSSSTRERQQIRIFIWGVVFAIMPLLLFYVLPKLFNWRYIVSTEYALVSLCFFPLALGYSILRYQILVLDSYVRRAVSYVVGIICLAVLIYLSVAFCEILLPGNIANHAMFYILGVGSTTTVLAPIVWWLATTVTERLFFSEILYYRQIIEQPEIIMEQTIDLTYAANLITSAAIHTFETTRAGLFVLDESSGCYHLVPSTIDGAKNDARYRLFEALLPFIQPAAVDKNVDWLEAQLPVLQRLSTARRPLLLSEAIIPESEAPRGLGRYLTSTMPTGDGGLLLAPVRVQGLMIGFLVLGERGDGQPYAGPDFEVVQILLARFSSVLETARLYARANQHAQLLNSVYSVSTMPGYTYQTTGDVAQTYATVAAEATMARADIWLYDEYSDVFRHITTAGKGSSIITADTVSVAAEDWVARFFDRNTPSSALPSCLEAVPDCSFVWLPLLRAEQHWGILVLSYHRPHFFMKEEIHVLEMFASQCVAALENMRMTTELLVAYERQKELDQLKDRFIMTASHEMRTPLTAVMGYIELLNEYNDTLPTEARADFIDKARLGCDELTLLVSNIMDASRVQIDVEHLEHKPIVLQAAIMNVLEILKPIIERENRKITVTMYEELKVDADDLRLRQVLLNLLTNALHYSESGTNIEIAAEVAVQQVVIRIRDYGLGVPLQDQKRLFERFIRLERDMNSSVRGTGLGLSVCKQLVEAMGGSIWVESSGEPGEGSSFIFTLHLAPHYQLSQA